jgi:hypothetical protein
MANTVNILSYNNTFGDLVAQQNKAAVELNNLAGGPSSNNFTKDTGTLILNGVGVALSVANTTSLGTTVTSNTSSFLGNIISTANAAFNGIGFGLTVANNAVIARTLITDSITANSLVRTATVNASGTAFVNGVTANTLIRTVTLNSTGASYLDSVTANTVVFSPFLNASTNAFVQNLSSNNTIYSKDLAVTGNISSSNVTTSFITGRASLISTSISVTPSTNTNNTQIATTEFVQNQLNAGNTYNHSVSGNAGTVTNGVYTNGSYADPAFITSLAGSKISGSISGSSANITNFIINQNLSTASDTQFRSLGVGTLGSGTTGEIRATNNITAYYSDDRLKKRLGNIENALAKVMSLNGFQYEANETAQALGYAVKPEIGLSAQEVQAVLPEVVVPAPIDEKYLTIHYERVIPLLVEAIKELKKEIDELKK